MEYFNLVLQVFDAALGWWTQVIAADPLLLYIFFGLIFANMVTRMFILPFAHGAVSGAGSDYATQKRRDRAQRVRSSKSTGMSVASDWY